jgi:prepilin-type N-terminal cleavage/methylation domain-containing protein
MLTGPKLGPTRTERRDDGFTLLELIIVTLIMSIILAIAGAVLFSLTTTANRNDSMVADEQAATTALAQLTRDIRSANTITFPTGAVASDTANKLELIVNQASGSTTPVLWVYDAAAQTLTRQAMVGTVFKTSGPVVNRVANPASSPVFSYINGKSGTSISGQSPANIALCATTIHVDIYVGAPPKTTGVSPFETSSDIALTNQLNTLTAPGNGQCGS